MDGAALTDSLTTYETPAGLYLPVGELSRLLDVDLNVSPRERRVSGGVGAARRPVLIDLNSGTLRLNGVATPLGRGDVLVGPVDLYVRQSLLERLLPIRLNVDKAGLRIGLRATETLPVQSRAERLGRAHDLGPNTDPHAEALRILEPYQLISPPTFDIGVSTAYDTLNKTGFVRRYDVRVGADVLYTGFQGYVGSDDTGAPSTARFLFERRDPDGLALAPLRGVTRVSVGDTFTPTMALGPRSVAGRGISLTTAPLEQASVFEQIDLRGELPIGYDVELYINDVLRGSQQQPVQGRYEFLAVPLVRGINTIRLVSYGPHGERSEQVRVISVGGGQLARGKLVIDAGLTQEGRNLVTLGAGEIDALQPGAGKLRAVLDAGYGLTNAITLVGGLGSYSPTGGAQREIGTVGLRGALAGFALEANAAHDSGTGGALSVGIAGRVFGASTVLQHAEYSGGFIDETLPEGGDGRALRRHDQATLDLVAGLSGGLRFPITAQIDREEFADHGVGYLGTFRATTAIARTLVSAGINYGRTQAPGGSVTDQLSANLAATTNTLWQWQVRASFDVEAQPVAGIRDVSITADHVIGASAAVRIGVGHSFEADRSTSLDGSLVWRLPYGDLSLDAGYVAPRNAWRLGMTFNFSLAYDPLGRRYAVGRPGAASGGNLAVLAFVDRKGDGRFSKGDEAVAGMVVDAGLSRATTDANGRAFITGLGYGPVARVRTNLNGVDLANPSAPAAVIEFVPHPGGVAVAMYPIKVQGEAFIRLLFRQEDGKMVGLAAVRIQAVREDGAHVDASTEYDGTVDLQHLAAGRYRLKIDPTQAERLGMRLAAPLVFVVPPEGGALPEANAVVEFTR